MRRLYSCLVTFMVIGAIFVSAAAADTTSSQPSCTTAGNGNVTCIQQTGVQIGQAIDHESASFKASANGKSKIVYLVSEHFVSYAQMKQAQANGSCRWFKKIWNSGFKDGTGALGWRIDHHVYGCKINGKWYKFGGGMTGEACGNLLRLISSPPPPSEVYERARFVAHMMWRAIVHLKATSHATVSVKVSVHNSDFSCVSSASGQSSSTGFAFASASATATSKATARAEAQGKAAKLTGYTNQQASVNATASAKTSATAQASAKASCSPTTPPPPPPPAQTCQTPGATNIGGSLPCQFPPPPATCQDTSATNYGGSLPCVYPPPSATLLLPSINMINVNNSSNCQPIDVNASSSGDTLKVNAQVAAVAQCDSSGNVLGSPSAFLTISVSPGDHIYYVDFFEYYDASLPQYDSAAVEVDNNGKAIATGTIGNGLNPNEWTINYPTRPS